MIKKRCQLVINNHRLSCSHTDFYIYILKGFSALKNLDLPLKQLDESPLTNDFYVIDYETVLKDKDIVKRNRKLCLVDFNLFIDQYLFEEKGTYHLSTYPELELEMDYINIFNLKNPLIGISDDLEADDNDKMDLLRNENLIK